MWLAGTVLLTLSLPFAVYSLDFQPTGYHLEIDVSDLNSSSIFTGAVYINLTTTTDLRNIVLDAVGLNVSSVNMAILPSNKDWNIVKNTTNGTNLYIEFSQPLPTSSYRLGIAFSGNYQNAMKGFAKVGFYYNNSQSYLGVTNFEPNYARYVFPCIDEPNPHVDIVLDVITRNQTVISSVQSSIIDDKETKKTYRFTSYPKMPVYQLGWMVLEDNDAFNMFSDSSKKTPVFTRALYPYSNYTSWATKLTAELLEVVGELTDLPYPLAKLEQLVVPDFFVGSVQSWGLISYSEEAFIVNTSTPATSTRVMHQVALGLAQQVLKQWFGDYVTMHSLKNSWLMNGFAEHLKFSLCDAIPEMSKWELSKHEVVELVQPALSMDSSEEITPLSNLDKYRGGALIRMLRYIAGDDLFKATVVQYLKDRKGSDGNDPTDLWRRLYKELSIGGVDLSGQSIQFIMDGWTETPGYPILNVTSNGTHFQISQSSPKRFVPVTYQLQGSPSRSYKVWLNQTYDQIVPAKGAKWILLNLNQTGYYRVNYDQVVLDGLKTDFAKLPPISRSQLVDDMFSLAMSGHCNMVQLLQFLRVLSNETDYFPWNSALRNFQNLIDKFYGHSSYEILKSFILEQMSTVITKVGLERSDKDSHTDILRRVMVLEKACAFGHLKCLQKADSILESGKADADIDLNMGLLCSAVSNGPEHVWWNLSVKITEVSSVRSEILKALTCTTNQPLLNNFLNNITSTTKPSLNPKDKNIFLETLASTPTGANMLWNWLVEKLDTQIDIRTTTLTPLTSTTSRPALNSSVSKEDSVDNATTSNDEGRMYSTSAAENLTEEVIERILLLILPKLTTIKQRDEIAKFVEAKNSSGLTNSTIKLLEKAKVQIYNQYQWAYKYNGDIMKWHESATTTTVEVTVNHPTTGITTVTPSGKPSSATSFYSSLALTVTVAASHYLMPHFQISV